MSKLLIGLFALLLLVGGCGVKKDYVTEQIAASEARTGAQISDVKDQTDNNAAEVARLKQLAGQLSAKTDLAIDKASGFENYQIVWSGEVNFDFDSFDVTDIGASILDEAGAKMGQVPSSLAEIAGYTDVNGSAKYNYFLGQERANSVKRYLTDKFGLSLYRMFVISHGETKPVALPDERNSASKNRRVTVNIWGPM